MGQISPKWDKSGAFSDQISVHLARGAPDLSNLGSNLAHFGAKPTIPGPSLAFTYQQKMSVIDCSTPQTLKFTYQQTMPVTM